MRLAILRDISQSRGPTVERSRVHLFLLLDIFGRTIENFLILEGKLESIGDS